MLLAIALLNIQFLNQKQVVAVVLSRHSGPWETVGDTTTAVTHCWGTNNATAIAVGDKKGEKSDALSGHFDGV